MNPYNIAIGNQHPYFLILDSLCIISYTIIKGKG